MYKRQRSIVASEKNNIFGLREGGVARSVSSIDECISTYERTLNTHWAYEHLRGGSLEDWFNGIGAAGYDNEVPYSQLLWDVAESWALL